MTLVLTGNTTNVSHNQKVWGNCFITQGPSYVLRYLAIYYHKVTCCETTSCQMCKVQATWLTNQCPHTKQKWPCVFSPIVIAQRPKRKSVHNYINRRTSNLIRFNFKWSHLTRKNTRMQRPSVRTMLATWSAKSFQGLPAVQTDPMPLIY